MSQAIDRFLVDRIGRALAKGRILDLPAGSGALGEQLRSAGFEVVSADLFPENVVHGAEHGALRADMNAVLPCEDGSFDGVVCQEGVEHVEHPALFFRECARVLRPGGEIWLTTPNFMDLSSRFAFFWTGMKSLHAGFPNEVSTVWGRDAERVYHGHAFTLPYFQIRYLLRVSGFEQVTVSGLKPSLFSSLLYGAVRPLSGLLIRRAFRVLANKRPERHDRSVPPELQRELLRDALSRELLCSRKICVRARRADPAA